MLTSAVLHGLLLVSLACWMLPSISGAKQILDLSVGESQSYVLESIDLSSEMETEIAADAESPSEVPVKFEVAPIELSLADSKSESESGTDGNAAPGTFAPPQFRPESLSTSTSVEGAVDQVTGELLAKLEKGDLLVVWLLDSSHSLVDDRQRVAARLTPFYEDLVQQRSSRKHQLVSAVVSFGKVMRERVAPTQFGNKIVAAVEDLPIDRSGKENVFEAVTQCAQHYRGSWSDRQLAIVIWTDESGDDVRYLENAIETCRDQKVTVSVVGPSSVLGADTGLHSYTDPKTENVPRVPTHRGSDPFLKHVLS